MIITLTLILWLASSLIEYKLVKSNRWMRDNFHGVRGIVISVVISGGIGLVASGTMGLIGTTAAVIATIIGLATNDFTFKMFSTIEDLNNKRKTTTAKVRSSIARNPQRYQDAKVGAKGIGAGIVSFCVFIGKVIRYIGWLCSRPAAINRSYQQLKLNHRMPKALSRRIS